MRLVLNAMGERGLHVKKCLTEDREAYDLARFCPGGSHFFSCSGVGGYPFLYVRKEIPAMVSNSTQKVQVQPQPTPAPKPAEKPFPIKVQSHIPF